VVVVVAAAAAVSAGDCWLHWTTVSSTKISLLKVSVNNKNNSKTSNQQQKEKTDRREIFLEPTVCLSSVNCYCSFYSPLLPLARLFGFLSMAIIVSCSAFVMLLLLLLLLLLELLLLLLLLSYFI
jgi:hypothetical protein